MFPWGRRSSWGKGMWGYLRFPWTLKASGSLSVSFPAQAEVEEFGHQTLVSKVQTERGKPFLESLKLHTGIWPMMSCRVCSCLTSKPPIGLHSSHSPHCSALFYLFPRSFCIYGSLGILTSHLLGHSLNVTSLESLSLTIASF